MPLTSTTTLPLTEKVSGIKYDGGKDCFHLIPWDALARTQKVLEFGAYKYGERNWENGIEMRRVWNAAMRHLTAYERGELQDPESGYSHLDHASCCIMFLQAFEERSKKGCIQEKV